MDKLTVRGYAKINLTLDVLGKREDGFHEVEMLMQGILWHDLIHLSKAKDAFFLTCEIAGLENPGQNLAYRAAVLLKKRYPRIGGANIVIEKMIPTAAGLGGGSADAAAVLLGLACLYKLDISMTELQEYGAELGSDVPFCLYPLTAVARGRGEKLFYTPACPVLWMTLVKPPFAVFTGEIYSRYREKSNAARPDLQAALAAIVSRDKAGLYRALANVLESVTFDLYPELRRYAAELREAGALKVMMSGSGPTLIAFSDSEEKARVIASLYKRPDWETIVTRTIQAEDLDAVRKDINL